MSKHRARIMGTRHMVAATHYLAAQAAFQVIEAGGNVVDAGVAGGIALDVVQSEMINFAGVAPIMIRRADTGECVTITGLGHWPKAASAEFFRRQHGGRIPEGYLSSVVPAAPDAWITALERYGTMGFGDVARAAVGFARDGFPTTTLMHEIISGHLEDHRRWPATAAIYLPNGKAPESGDLFVQSDLARTLQYMADQERAAAFRDGRSAGLQAARDAFYRGDIARMIARDYKENGGWLSEEDLAEFRVEIRPPVKARLKDVEVYSCGPWCQGPVLSQTLAILDGIDLEALTHNSAGYIHLLVEAFKLAFADRHHYYGDPNFVDVPMARLLSPDYAAERRKLIDPRRAAPGMPAPGSVERPGAAASSARRPPKPTKGAVPEALDTAYVCVVDRQGNAFSATPSDASYNGPVVPGTGISPSSRGTQSWTDPQVPACLAPGKRPRLTPNPAIAVRPGRWCMPFGSPGNDVQPQAMGQVLFNMVVFGMTPQQAVDAPRFATLSYPRSSEPHAYNPGQLKVESLIPEKSRDALAALGHKLEEWPASHWQAGAVCVAVADIRKGVIEGASDARRPTGTVGW